MSELDTYNRLDNQYSYRNINRLREDKTKKSPENPYLAENTIQKERLILHPLVWPVNTNKSVYSSIVIPEKIVSGVSNMKPRMVEKTFQPKGVYVNADITSCDDIFPLINRLKELNYNTLMFDINDSGKIRYETSSRFAITNKIVNGTIPVKKLIYHLKKKGVHSVARICCFNNWPLAYRRPDLRISSSSTNTPKELNNWVDPESADVQDFIIEIAVELAKTGVDEINLDYARFPSYRDLKTKNADRTEVICSFLEKARTALQPYGVRLSVDVFAIIAWEGNEETTRIIGQDLGKIKKHVDMVYLMLYPSLFSGIPGIVNPADKPYEIITQTCEQAKKIFADSPEKLAVILQAFGYKNIDFPYSPAYAAEELKAAKDSVIKSVMWWNFNGNYNGVFSALEINQYIEKNKPEPVQ